MAFLQKLSQLRSPVAAYANLPVSANVKGDLRITTDTGEIYMWNSNVIGGNDSYTKLLLHLDNNVTDSESSPKTVTNNNVTFSSDVKKLGTHAAVLNGTSSYLSTPSSEDFNFGTNPFTVDCWVRFNSIGAEGQGIFSQMIYPHQQQWMNYTGNTSNTLQFLVWNFAAVLSISCSFTPVIDTWYHIALVRINNNDSITSWRIFINGVSQTLSLQSPTWSGSSFNVGVPFCIGQSQRDPSNNPTQFLNGYIDEFRVSKGIARWTSNFTPSSVPYDTNTGILSDWNKVTSSDYNDLSGAPVSSGLAIDNAVNIVTDLSINIAILAWQTMTSAYAAIVKMFDGIVNRFATESGIQLDECSNQVWNDVGDNSFYQPASSTNMTLQSVGYVANYVPTSARIVILEEDVDVIEENTDLVVSISRDGGTTFNEVTLTKDSSYGDGTLNIFTGSVDISAPPLGQLMVWKLVTQNTKDCRVRGVALNWK